MQPDDLKSAALDERLVALPRLLHPRDTPRWKKPVRAVLAVSGGPDSLSMLALVGEARQALADAGFLFSVATVDHGLRTDSAIEAAHVEAVARDQGLDHATLHWRGWTGIGNLQAAAREGRYALLIGEARARSATAIVTAHTLDDQIETSLMARARGLSGPALAGMRASRDLAPGIVLIRPFLHLRKAELGAILARSGLVASHDPSNDDPRFRRVQMRRDVALLTPREQREILDALEEARQRRAEEDERFLDAVWSTPREVLQHCDRLGRLFRDHEHLRSLQPEIATRLVARAVTASGGAPYPASAASAARLAQRLRRARTGFAATLNGCQVRLVDRTVVFSREYGRAGPAPTPVNGAALVFDGRFDISVFGTDRVTTGRWIVPFGRFGRGNERERTLPVLTDAADEILSAHEAVAEKAGVRFKWLSAFSRVEWRFLADLRDRDDRPASPKIAILDPVEPGGPHRLAFGPDHRR